MSSLLKYSVIIAAAVSYVNMTYNLGRARQELKDIETVMELKIEQAKNRVPS